MNDDPNEQQKISLAQALSRGQAVASWAQRNESDVRLAREWCEAPEFIELVDSNRRDSVKRLVGKLQRAAERASKRMDELAQSDKSESVKLAAARALFATWLEVSEHFDFAEQVAQIKKRVKALEDARRFASPNRKFPG